MDNKPLFDDKEDTIQIPVVEEKQEERPRPRISPETKVTHIEEKEEVKIPEESTLADIIDDVTLEDNTTDEEEKQEETEKVEMPLEEKLITITKEVPTIDENKKVEETEKIDLNHSVKLIATIALFIIIGFFFLRTVYAFYIGFKYYDMRNQVTEINK